MLENHHCVLSLSLTTVLKLYWVLLIANFPLSV